MKNSSDPAKNAEKTTLKPLWGIPVKIWVPCLWAGVALLLLWFIAPVLFHPQSTLSVTSSPSGTPVFWQEEFVGHTPLKIKITNERRGEGVLILERADFGRVEENLHLSSWSFPLSFLGDQKLAFTLEPKLSNAELLNKALKNLSAWASLGEPSPSRPIPALFSDFARDFSENPELPRAFLSQGFPLINSSFLWHDFWSAYEVLFDFKSQDPWARWMDLSGRFNLDNYALGAFYKQLSPADQESLKAKPEFVQFLTKGGFSVELSIGNYQDVLPSLPSVLASSFLLVESNYNKFGGTEFLPLGMSPENVEASSVFTAPFYLSRRPVTKGEIESFLSTNAYWRREYTEALQAEGLVDENYLRPSKWETLRDSDPAVFIPYYLAKAYIDWFNVQNLKGTGLIAKLPASFQWWALPASFRTPATEQALGLWYWMRDPHLADADGHRRSKQPFGIAEDFPAFEGEIRSLPNALLDLDKQTPASLPRHWSAPHLSFYLVIEKE